MVLGIAAGEDGLARAAEEAFAQGFVAFQRRQQVGAVVVAGGMTVERRAVADHGTLQALVEQLEACDQLVDGPQHGAGHVVGVDLVAAHHQ
ncbi:hypothetical protein D3C85_1180020 [compost metagenome]